MPTPFITRMDRATARAMTRFGRTSFKWKAEGPMILGDFGQESETKVEGGKKRKRAVLEVRKLDMSDKPVIGRELLIGAEKWEVDAFEHDAVTWTITIGAAKQASK